MANFHDAFRLLPQKTQTLTYSTSAGASVSSAGFTTQTYWINVAAPVRKVPRRGAGRDQSGSNRKHLQSIPAVQLGADL